MPSRASSSYVPCSATTPSSMNTTKSAVFRVDRLKGLGVSFLYGTSSEAV